MKRNLKVGLLILVLVLANVAVGEAMGLFRKQKGEFRFEDYGNAEKAQAALLEMYPVGSRVEDVVRTLTAAGATCVFFDGKSNKEIDRLVDENDFIYCGYTERELFFFASDWQISIRVNMDTKNLVSEIKMSKFFQSL